MKNPGILVAARCCLLIIVLLSTPAHAQEATAAPEDWAQLRTQAAELHSRAKQMRLQADKTRADAEVLCRDKLLYASCMDMAKAARQEAERAIHRVETEAAGMERRLRYHDLEVKREKRAAQDREDAADAAQRAEEIRRKDEKRRLKEEKRAAEEARRRQKAGGG